MAISHAPTCTGYHRSHFHTHTSSLVWVVLDGELAVGIFDLCVSCSSRHTKHLPNAKKQGGKWASYTVGDDGECDATLQGHVETHIGMEKSLTSSAKKAAASDRSSLTRSWNVSPYKGLLASATPPTSLERMLGFVDSPLQRGFSQTIRLHPLHSYTPYGSGGFLKCF